MDSLIDGIIIVFVLSCIVFFYNALKIQHGSKNFPTPKRRIFKKELDGFENKMEKMMRKVFEEERLREEGERENLKEERLRKERELVERERKLEGATACHTW